MTSRPINSWFVFTRFCWAWIVMFSAYTVGYVLLVLFSWSWFSDVVRYAAPLFASDVLRSNLALLAHILTAVPCLLLGPFLFIRRLRSRFIHIHRWMGRVYVFTVFVSAPIGFALASVNQFGPFARGGFMTLAVVWFFTTWVAYRKILAHDWQGHRRWMIRSYAISIAVITVRFLPAPGGMSRDVWYPIVTWLCWVPNSLLAEIYVRISDHNGNFVRPPRMHGASS